MEFLPHSAVQIPNRYCPKRKGIQPEVGGPKAAKTGRAKDVRRKPEESEVRRQRSAVRNRRPDIGPTSPRKELSRFDNSQNIKMRSLREGHEKEKPSGEPKSANFHISRILETSK
jgi:hypothetical protein